MLIQVLEDYLGPWTPENLCQTNHELGI